jgi:hypothetical protein
MMALPDQRLGLLLRSRDLGAGFCLHHDGVDGVCLHKHASMLGF